MTDKQSWRRHTQLAKLLSADVQACSPLDGGSLSASPTESTKPRPRRSLASFASYLSTHKTGPTDTQPEWSSFDWSNLKVKDDVYRPDPDRMCETLRQHVLANPSSNLPAQYNSFVLHVIEAYESLKSEKMDLETKFQAEEQCHKADVREFHLAALIWSSADGIRAPIKSEPHPIIPTDGEHLDQARSSGGNLLSLLPRIDTGHSKMWQRNLQSKALDGGFTVPSHTGMPIQRPSSQPSWTGAIKAAFGPNDKSRSHSNSTSGTVPKNLSPSSTESDSSSDDEDHRALTSIALAASDYSNKGRLLSQQFEYRKDPEEGVPLENSDSRSSSNGLSRNRCPSTAGNSPVSLASAGSAATAIKEPMRSRCTAKEAKFEPGVQTVEALRKRRQHRGFSFMPGDDSGLPRTSNCPVTDPEESRDSSLTPPADIKEKASQRKPSEDSLGSQWTTNIDPVSNPYPMLTNSVVALAEGQQKPAPPQREGSSKSVLTAIKESSRSRSSSLSHKDSIGSIGSKGSSSVTRKTSADNSFAIAAARAARNRQTDT